RPPPDATLFPYTTLFRSNPACQFVEQGLLTIPCFRISQGQLSGSQGKHGPRVAIQLVMVVHERKHAQDGDNEQENNDQRRDQTTQKRFRRKKLAVSRLCNEARISSKNGFAPPHWPPHKSLPAGRVPRVRLGHQWLSPKPYSA